YGRTKDGIASFNGSAYKIISNQIRRTLQNCIVPEGDSGVYDFGTGRYYLTVCDSRLTGSYNQSFNSNNTIFLAFRNTTIVFDAPSGTWETHKNVFYQVFAKIKDSYGKQRIIAGGVLSDYY